MTNLITKSFIAQSDALLAEAEAVFFAEEKVILEAFKKAPLEVQREVFYELCINQPECIY